MPAPNCGTSAESSESPSWGLGGHDRVTLFRGVVHAKVKGHAVEEGSSAACCTLRSSATRALSILSLRGAAGRQLRPEACWSSWMGSERSRWRLLPSEVIDHVCGQLRPSGFRVFFKNSIIKGASFFCACWGWLEVPATPYLGRSGGYVVALGMLMCSPEHQQRCAAQDCMP